MTLPIGGRIALPSSINTYISVVKNTSLMYVIGYPELTTTAINISNLTLETTEALTVLAIVYLTLVWALSALIRLLEARLALPEASRSSDCPTGPSRSPLHPRGGAAGDAQARDGAVIGSTVIGIVLGTLITIRLPPLAAADPGLHRDLPRAADPRHRLHRLLRAPGDLADARVRPDHGDLDRAHPLGQRAGRGGDARRRPVDPARAARGRVGARLRLGRPPPVRDPAAGVPPPPAAARQPARQHHPELDARRR